MRQTKQIKRIMQMEENLDAAKEVLEENRLIASDALYSLAQMMGQGIL